MKNILPNLLLVSIIILLFEPERIVLFDKLHLDDLFIVINIFITLVVLIDRKFTLDIENVKSIRYCLILSVICLSVIITFIQIIVYDFNANLFLDIYKIIKLFVIFIFIALFTEEEMEYFYSTTIRFVKMFIIMTFIINIAQHYFNELALFRYYSQFDEHFESLNYGTFGFIGNRSQAGFVALITLTIMLILNKPFYAAIAFSNVLFHFNKIAIFTSLIIMLIYVIAGIVKKDNRRSSNVMALLLIIGGLYFSLSYRLENIILDAAGDNIQNIHTISHRLDMLENTMDNYNKNKLLFLLFGYPEKGSWSEAFDSQYLLLVNRYGLIYTLIFLMTPVLIFRNKFFKLYTLIVILIPSVTMVNIYHYRVSFIFMLYVFIIWYFYQFINQSRVVE